MCPKGGNSTSDLVVEVDLKVNKDLVVDTSNKKENMLCNEASTLEKQDRRFQPLET